MNLPVESFESRDEAIKYGAEHLRGGTLCLAIGAGASAPLGFPTWEGLLRRCMADQSLPLSSTLGLDLSASVLGDHCRRNRIDLRDVVHAALYQGGALSPQALTSSPRLAALGALLMGSRRGSVQTVITFNYDSLLEEYLRLYGYDSRAVSALPSLHGAEDVTVFHPHGYLPSDPSLGARSETIVLTRESFNQILGDPASSWVALLRHLIRTKILLLIGISVDSVAEGPLGTLLQFEAPALRHRGPSAIWLTVDSFDAAYVPVLRNQNVAAVRLPDFESIDDFLLRTCQVAASGMRSALTS